MMVVANSNATFSVIATGTAPLSYQWQWKGTNIFNGGQLTGVTSNALTVANAQLSNAGLYDVVVTNTAGCATSTVANLVVFVPPSITTQPHSITNSVGSTATFSVVAAGSGPFSYQWRWNDTSLSNGGQYSGVTNYMLMVTDIQMSNAGNYNVLVTNLVGSVISSNAVLTVK